MSPVDAPQAKPPSAARRWLRRVAWTAAGIGGLWALGWLAVPPLLKHQGEKIATEKLGRKTTIGAVEFKPWTLELTVRDLAIASADGKGEQLRIPRIYIDGELQSLLRLAPVVDAIQVDAPQVRLTHHGDGRYDIQDILDRLGQQPAPTDPKAQPARFALYNIALQGGSIDFVDETVGRTHTVRDLVLNIPFLSNLDSQRAVKVLPRLAFQLNGDGFESAAEGTPFQDNRKTDASLKLDGFDLAPYLGYLPAGLPVALQAATLDADIRVAFEAVPAAAQPVSLRLTGTLQLSQFKAADRKGQELLAFDALKIGLDDVRPLEGVVRLSSVALDAPRLQVRRDSQGVLNLATLAGGEGSAAKKPPAAAPTAQASAPASAAPAATAAAPSPAWNIEVAQLAVQNGQVHWQDGSTSPAAQLALNELNLQAQALTWPARKPAPLEGSVRIQPGGKGAGAGEGGVVKFSGSGTDKAAQLGLVVDGLPLSLAQAYVEPFLVPQLTGSLSAQLGLGWRAPDLAVHIQQASLDKLSLQDGKTSLASLGSLKLADTAVDLAQRSVKVGKLALAEPKAAVERERNGQWMFQRWLRAPAGGAPVSEAPTPAPQAPAKPWSVVLSELAVDGGALAFKDASTAQPVAFQVSGLNVQAKDLAPTAMLSPGSTVKPSPLTVSARIGAGRAEPGRLDYQGTVGLAPLSAQGQLTALRMPVHAAMPYVSDMLNVDVRRADASYKGSVRFEATPAGPQVQLLGDAALEELRSNSVLALPPLPDAVAAAGGDSAPRGEPLLNWKALSLRGLDVALAPGSPTRVKVQETALNDFFARLVLFEDGKLNLADLVKPAPVAAGKSAEVASAPAEISFGPVALVNGRVAFSDRFIKPNYSINISELTGRLSAFTSVAPKDAPQMADLELRGRAEGTAALEVTGKLNPLAKPLALDVQAKVQDLELAPLSPYTVKYAGHGIERGKLNVDVAYKILPDGQLTASNKIVLRQLVFGDEVPGAPTSLPVRLATALLADSNGVIDIDLPVSGSINDPQFRLGPVIFKAIGNLIVKAITSPFSLLAGALGGGAGDELNTVPFAAGSAELSPEARESLDKIAKALESRPALKMTVVGHASMEAEHDALKRARLMRMLRAEKRRTTIQSTGTASATAEQGTEQGAGQGAAAPLAISDAEYPELLTAVYKRADMSKPRNMVGMAKTLPVPEMEALLLANIDVADDAARTLATQRGVAVRDYLTQQKLPLDRLFLGATKVAPPDDKWKPRADLSLSMR